MQKQTAFQNNSPKCQRGVSTLDRRLIEELVVFGLVQFEMTNARIQEICHRKMNTEINISCNQFHELWKKHPEIILIDCREQEEYDLVHIRGATLFPMSTITEKVGQFEHLKNQQFVVHCHHGGRSLRVVNWLRKQGFEHAQNLTGGIDQWASDIDQSLPRY